MKKSVGKTDYYNHFLASLKIDIEAKKKRLLGLRTSRIGLIDIIEDNKFSDAYVVLPSHEPIEYMAYFYRIKDMQRHFKLNECSVINNEEEEHTHSMFLIGVLYNTMKYNRAIVDIEEQIEELYSYEISNDIYRGILDTYDALLAGYLLDGKNYPVGSGIGSLYIREKNRSYRKKVVNYEASNKERIRLLEEGLIPYRKKDEDKAIAEGREYKGIKWLIYWYDKTSYWLNWQKSKFVKNVILYKFVPTIRNHTEQSVYDLAKQIKFENIPNYKLGFTQMIQMCIRMNPDQAKIYRNNSFTA